MMNGQWFEEIFLYNESSQVLKSFVSAKRFSLLLFK